MLQMVEVAGVESTKQNPQPPESQYICEIEGAGCTQVDSQRSVLNDPELMQLVKKWERLNIHQKTAIMSVISMEF